MVFKDNIRIAMKTNTFKSGIFILLISISSIVIGQNVSISEDDTYIPEASAMLDVYSQDKGLLVPRVTTAERGAISSPATGLLVFDTDENSYYFYTGIIWKSLSFDSGA